MSCCGNNLKNLNAFTNASGELSSRLSSRHSSTFQSLLTALDHVEVRMRAEAYDAKFKPTMFETKVIEYGRKPSGTEVLFEEAPLYFQNNADYAVEYMPASAEGGLCSGNSLCGEIEGFQLPGDSYSTVSYSMKETAIDTPEFCLRDLFHFENGMEYLSNRIKKMERAPAQFFDNYIRNAYWDSGQKYLLHATDRGPLFNTHERVASRETPNWLEFVASGGAEVSGLTLQAIQAIKYYCKESGNAGYLKSVPGQRTHMMVGSEFDFFLAVNNSECGTCSFVEGGLGFTPFSYQILDSIPFGIRWDNDWFRVFIDKDTGEIDRIPRYVEVGQNGGTVLVPNNDYLNSEYGVLTLAEEGAFKYLQFGQIPKVPGQVPEQVYRHLNPKFDLVPKYETCNYSKGIVAWRMEHLFDFMYTGAEIKHVIYKRDRVSSTMREVKAGVCINETEDCSVLIPNSCGRGSIGKCCVATLPGYEDSGYTLEITPEVLSDLGITSADVPSAQKFETVKGVFDVEILSVNTAETLLTFGVDPEQHQGGHFCCSDQLVGFVVEEQVGACSVGFQAGVAKDCYDATGTIYGGLITDYLNAAVGDVVALLIDAGCGVSGTPDVTITELEGQKVKFEIDPEVFKEGLPCDAVIGLAAYNSEGCETVLDGLEQPECGSTGETTQTGVSSKVVASDNAKAEVKAEVKTKAKTKK